MAHLKISSLIFAIILFFEQICVVVHETITFFHNYKFMKYKIHIVFRKINETHKYRLPVQSVLTYVACSIEQDGQNILPKSQKFFEKLNSSKLLKIVYTNQTLHLCTLSYKISAVWL